MPAPRTLIRDAISKFPLQSSAAWAQLSDGADTGDVRIEPDERTINTVDNLFEGAVRIFLAGKVVPARVFGRFSERRAEVDRIVIAA